MPNNPFKSERLTTEYVQDEDRLRLNLEDAQQERVTLWLTQRLLNRVIPALVKVLEEETSGTPQAQEVQAFTQEKAQLRAQRAISHEQPIPEAEESWLVTRVDLTPASRAIALVFWDNAGHSARLEMPRTAMRQWLSIVHELYVRAEWGRDKWPDWLAPLSNTPAKESSKLH